jgi:hypothetical protein
LLQRRSTMIHPKEWIHYIKWRIEKALKRMRQFMT